MSLDLSFAGLSGVLPPVLQYLPQLRTLNLAHNNFSGEPPGAWGLWGSSVVDVFLQVGGQSSGACWGRPHHVLALPGRSTWRSVLRERTEQRCSCCQWRAVESSYKCRA